MSTETKRLRFFELDGVLPMWIQFLRPSATGSPDDFVAAVA
jgi:hypothetical protein